MFSNVCTSNGWGDPTEQKEAVWNIQQELSERSEGSAKEPLTLLRRNGVLQDLSEGRKWSLNSSGKYPDRDY